VLFLKTCRRVSIEEIQWEEKERGKTMSNSTLIIVIVVLILLFGGGGFYWRGRRR
jgi:flagellar basal body-associated protein FliL